MYAKREEQNPTGSFKARGLSAAVSLLVEHGVRKAAIGSNGNAGSALAAYAARAGVSAHVCLPEDCPGLIVDECRRYGAQVCLVRGLIHDAGRLIDEGREVEGWFNVGTLREPGRVEGKKTMGLSGGTAVAVSREEIESAQARFGSLGLSSSPEGAATLAGLLRLREDAWIRPGDEVVLFNTAGATKYRPWTSPERIPVVTDYSDYRDRVARRRGPEQHTPAMPA